MEIKKDKLKSSQVMLSFQDLEKLKKLAKDNHRTLSSQIRYLIKLELKEF